MKKILSIFIIILFLCSGAHAFLYQVEIPTKEEFTKMTDQGLLDLYIEIVIERKASETFHGIAGFNPKGV